jgi:hypothetical protein
MTAQQNRIDRLIEGDLDQLRFRGATVEKSKKPHFADTDHQAVIPGRAAGANPE